MGVTALRQGLKFALIGAQRRLLVALEIPSKDRSYEWVLNWMAYQGQSQWAKRMHQLSVETTLEQRRDGGVNAAFTLVAGPGTHWVRWRGAWLQVSHGRPPIPPSLLVV